MIYSTDNHTAIIIPRILGFNVRARSRFYIAIALKFTHVSRRSLVVFLYRETISTITRKREEASALATNKFSLPNELAGSHRTVFVDPHFYPRSKPNLASFPVFPYPIFTLAKESRRKAARGAQSDVAAYCETRM